MSRKSKLFFSLVSLCFSIAVLCFGVYSALSVSYTVSGSVSYEIQDVFVSVTRKVYRALSETPVQSSHSGNVTELKTAQTIDTSKYDDIGAGDSFSTYDNGKVTSSGQDYTYPEDGDESKNIDLTYGSPTGNETQGYAFYIVIDIHNLGSEIINAQITAPTSLENTILRDSGNVEITANGTERIVLGLALDDVTTGITSADFTYKITISCGELPIEPITDMEFSLNEAGTATLESYTGSGGDVVIPESIGYDTTSSKTLTFNTMEDMVSGMNMLYFFQDLYITLPNQEEQLIENAYLWMLKNMDKETGSLPQNYFPMTIQTVESYTINQDDYKQYADFGQDMTAMLAFAPIQMIMQNMLLTSVDVQYGEEKQSFTFNMENYNAAVNEGDDSETSKAIDYFMSKAYDAAESLLPVTYSNFEYNVAVKGDEYTVTTIASRAFSSQYKIAIRNLYIPNSITNIESYSFDHYNVSEVLIENIYAEDLDTLLNIDYDFITVSESHTGDSIISHVNPFYIADNVYINGEPLPEEITVGEGLTEIKPGTLAGLFNKNIYSK